MCDSRKKYIKKTGNQAFQRYTFSVKCVCMWLSPFFFLQPSTSFLLLFRFNVTFVLSVTHSRLVFCSIHCVCIAHIHKHNQIFVRCIFHEWILPFIKSTVDSSPFIIFFFSPFYINFDYRVPKPKYIPNI